MLNRSEPLAVQTIPVEVLSQSSILSLKRKNGEDKSEHQKKQKIEAQYETTVLKRLLQVEEEKNKRLLAHTIYQTSVIKSHVKANKGYQTTRADFQNVINQRTALILQHVATINECKDTIAKNKKAAAASDKNYQATIKEYEEKIKALNQRIENQKKIITQHEASIDLFSIHLWGSVNGALLVVGRMRYDLDEKDKTLNEQQQQLEEAKQIIDKKSRELSQLEQSMTFLSTSPKQSDSPLSTNRNTLWKPASSPRSPDATAATSELTPASTASDYSDLYAFKLE